ncbi:hypothetical protein HS088_TW14G00105 [Tripterygium wilfordii]|uniref:pectinesterase n=1 Tax=Tripterygium wilfordii TaxID=458696 RepID=A0A7J7CPF2_TRIWF|nr:hypothetical protein HS088_TW14G00105 [Tripterygium wilfordii]
MSSPFIKTAICMPSLIARWSLTAQKRWSLLEETGSFFVNRKVTGSDALHLGRAWPHGVLSLGYMDKIITPRGWYDWGDKNRQMYVSFMRAFTQCRTVFYGQYKCIRPGTEMGGRVSCSRELTEEEAEPFTSNSFIDGGQCKWLPESSQLHSPHYPS